MRIYLEDLIAPHHCCSCGDIGAVLCDYCKYDIIDDIYDSCVICRRPVGRAGEICRLCKSSYSRAWCIGERSDTLKRLIDAYKFERVRAAHQALAGLLDETLPQLPTDILIVPVPTIMPHVRVRGYAHVELVAKRLADIRGHTYAEVLARRHNQPQRGAMRQERIKRASLAFNSKQLDGQACLLVDDVFTTGSTLEYAARELKAAGASSVWVAVLSRQPLEKTP